MAHPIDCVLSDYDTLQTVRNFDLSASMCAVEIIFGRMYLHIHKVKLTCTYQFRIENVMCKGQRGFSMEYVRNLVQRIRKYERKGLNFEGCSADLLGIMFNVE